MTPHLYENKVDVLDLVQASHFAKYGRILDFVDFAIHSGESCPFYMPVFRQVWCQVFLRTFGVPDRRFMLSLIKISVSVYTRSY